MIKVVLKDAVAGREYYAFLNVDGVWVPPYVRDGGTYVGSGTVNKNGNVNIHVNYTIPEGVHTVYVQLCDVSGWYGYYDSYANPATMTFE